MTTKTELTQNDILCTKATLVLHKSTSDNTVLKFAISQAADMLECLAEILRESKPVYQINFNFADDDWYDCTKIEYDKTWRKKRTLYTHPQPVKKCELKIGFTQNFGNSATTSCGRHFKLNNNNNPKINGFKFCHYCGGEIVEVK